MSTSLQETAYMATTIAPALTLMGILIALVIGLFQLHAARKARQFTYMLELHRDMAELWSDKMLIRRGLADVLEQVGRPICRWNGKRESTEWQALMSDSEP